MTQTICEIDLRAFAHKPTPQELGSIVARWTSTEQAEFFMEFGEQLQNCCGGRHFMQWQYIADSLREMEDRLCAGSGSRLIAELHGRLAHADAA